MRVRLAASGAIAILLVGVSLWLLMRDDPALLAVEPTLTTPRPGPASRTRLRTSGEAVAPSQTPSETFDEAPITHRDASVPREPDGGEADASGVDGLVAGLRADMVNAWLRTNAAAAEKYVDRYCEENKRLKKLRGTSPPTHTNDAAIFMAVRIDWEDGRVGLLHLPATLTQHMANPPMNWRTFGPADYAGLDFTWMKDLAQFDYWSLSGDGPLKDLDQISYLTAPIPNYLMMQSWAKLRLIKGRDEHDLAQASVEVRHLADLIASSGTLIGEMIRAAMYGIERRVWDDAGLVAPEPLPSADDVQRLRASAFAGMYFLFPGVKREVREKALACVPTRCASLTEAIGATAALRTVYPAADEHLAWLTAQEPCDPPQARRLARGPGLSVEALQEEYPGTMGVERYMEMLTDGGL